MKTIAVANQKGGVGKTTIARNLAFFAMKQNLKVLCIDFDPQRNFSKTFKLLAQQQQSEMDLNRPWLTSSELFLENLPEDLSPLPCSSNSALIAADKSLVDLSTSTMDNLMNPAQHLAEIGDDYDVCIIDTAPTLGYPLYAALIAADYALCPCTMDQDAIDGLTDLFEDIARVQQLGWNPELVNLGLIANRVNARRSFDRNALSALRDELPDTVFDAVLYDRAATQYAKDHPVWKGRSGQSQILAAKEMTKACEQIFEKAGI